MTAASASPLIDRRPLTEADFEALERCGIDRRTAEAAGLFRVDSAEGARLVGRRPGSGDYSGLAYPYYLPGQDRPREYRLRLDNPPYELQPDGSRKPRAKYLSPPGARPMLYFPPGTRAEWLQDSSLPIYLVEGEKKTLALHDLGWHGLSDAAERPRWLSVGIGGVWNWRGRTGTETGPNGERLPVTGAIQDLNLLAWRGRRVVIVFDTNVRSNPQVQAARWELTRELRRRGARVNWFHWPRGVPESVNGVDDLVGAWGRDRVLEVLESGAVREAPQSLTDCERFFERADEDRFRLELPSAGIVIEADRLKWSSGELHGELLVRCDLPGVRAYGGVVAVARVNLSSIASRKSFTKELQARASVEGLDWSLLLEELAQRVLAAQRSPAEVVELSEAPLPETEDLYFSIDGFRLLRRHPNLIFSVGGGAKSYLALFLAARLATAGERVLYIDTEADVATHRLRLHRLFGPKQIPGLLYHRAYQPLAEAVDGLRRLIADRRVTFVVVDSVSCAADGPLEESATATRLFQALRRFNCGSLLLAHTQKSVEGRDRTPFGSVFFTNLSRRVWSAEKIDDAGDTFVVKLRCTKSNFGGDGEIFCWRFIFGGRDAEARTEIFPVDPSDVEEAAAEMPLVDRIAALLRKGPLTRAELASELEATDSAVRQAIHRNKDRRFVVLPGGKVALLSKEQPS